MRIDRVSCALALAGLAGCSGAPSEPMPGFGLPTTPDYRLLATQPASASMSRAERGPLPGIGGTGELVCPPVSPAPGGGTTCYPEGTVFATGEVSVTIGPDGRFTPSHIYVRSGATTTILNRDTRPHSFIGFNGATHLSDSIPPGGRLRTTWLHAGTWTFHDAPTSQAPPFSVTNVPYTGQL